MTSPDELTRWRDVQRANLLAQRTSLSTDQHRSWNDTITALLLQGFPLMRGSILGFYWPFKGEFDPRFAIYSLRQAGARVALPVVLQKNAPLEYREWWPGVASSKGVFDLPIPHGTEVLQPQVVLIPPVGFDAQGHRLGYGGGYFDRTLAAMSPQPLKIAVGFELSRMATIQPQWHDVAMDFVVTEAGIHRVGENGLERVIGPLLAADLAHPRTPQNPDAAAIR